MKRILSSSISYLITGVGTYYLLSGNVSIASNIILAIGLIGIFLDITHAKSPAK